MTLACQAFGTVQFHRKFEQITVTETVTHGINPPKMNDLPLSSSCLFPNTCDLTAPSARVHNSVRNVPGSDHDQHYNNL